MSERQCHYCKTQTENAFGGLLEATSVFGPIQIGTDEGPVPFNPDVDTDR